MHRRTAAFCAQPFVFLCKSAYADSPSARLNNIIKSAKDGEIMWIILSAVYLSILNIAGDNIGLVPDMAGELKSQMYTVTLFAYLFIGPVIGALTAWIGVKGGQDIVQLTGRLYGPAGKVILAYVILGVCIPASALTGGYYAGHLLHNITGLPVAISMLLSVALFCFVSAGKGMELLNLSNYLALLFIPLILIIACMNGIEFPTANLSVKGLNWLLVFALVGYNVQGMSAVLIIETGACLAGQGYKGIGFIALAKTLEAALTLLMVALVLRFQAAGPVALAAVMHKAGGEAVAVVFNIVAFSTLFSNMVPAMRVNVQQISLISGLPFWSSNMAAGTLVAGMSFMPLQPTVTVMGYTSLLMLGYIFYTAYFLHKNSRLQ
jgi:hypothetical protein